MKLTQKQALLMQLGIFNRALSIMLDKRKDYSGEEDPFANLRMSVLAGVEPWRGVMVRNMDKFSRRRHIMEAGGKTRVDQPMVEDWADTLNYLAIEAGLEIEELQDEETLYELMEEGRELDKTVQGMVQLSEEME